MAQEGDRCLSPDPGDRFRERRRALRPGPGLRRSRVGRPEGRAWPRSEVENQTAVDPDELLTLSASGRRPQGTTAASARSVRSELAHLVQKYIAPNGPRPRFQSRLEPLHEVCRDARPGLGTGNRRRGPGRDRPRPGGHPQGPSRAAQARRDGRGACVRDRPQE